MVKKEKKEKKKRSGGDASRSRSLAKAGISERWGDKDKVPHQTSVSRSGTSVVFTYTSGPCTQWHSHVRQRLPL